MSSPVRTCIGCRRTAGKAELVRLVWQQGVVIDHRQRQPGRGAYLHPETVCLTQALRRRAVGRALRVSGVDADALTRRWDAELLPRTA